MKTITPAFVLLLAPALRAQFSEAAPLPGDLTVGPSAGQQEKAAVAWGGSHYLAVWEELKSGLGGFVANPTGLFPNHDVYGVLLDEQGQPLSSAPLVINQDPWDQEHVRVAWNGTSYLVVWESTRTTAVYKTLGIYAARVDPSGAVLDDPPLLIDDADDLDERFPIVTSDGSGWIVAWTDDFGSTTQRVSGAYVDGSGLVLLKRTLVPTSSPLPTNYEIAFAQDRLALVYERNYSNGIATRLFDSGLNQIGAEISLGSGVKPSVGSNGGSFYVAWLSGGVRGTPLSSSGGVGIPGGAPLHGSLSLGDPEVAVAWDGSEWFALFDGSGEIFGSQVDPSGSLQAGSPFTVDSGIQYVREPACANGNGRALGIWTDWRNAGPFNVDPFDVYGKTAGPGAQLSAPIAITVSPPAQVAPAIAGDATSGYMVVFQSRSSGLVRILGQRLSPTGQPLDAEPIEIASGPSTIQGTMDVAWDGAEWLVAWYQLIAGGPPYLFHTFARRVSHDGSLPEAAPFFMQRGTRPTIAAVQGVFLVTTHWHYPPQQSNEIYHAKRLRGSDGAILDTSEIPIDYGSGRSDSVGFDDRWLVVWGGVTGAFVFPDGTVGTPFYAANTNGGSVDLSLARNGDEALLVFQYNASLYWNADIRARRIHKDGTLLDSMTGSFVSSADNGQLLPAATWYGSRYLITFTDYRDHVPLEPALGDVYAVRVSGDNQILDVPELPVLNGFPRAEGRTAVAGGAERAWIVSSVLEGGDYGTWRLFLQGLIESDIGQSYCGPAVPNSSGLAGEIRAYGSTLVADNDLRLEATRLPLNKVGIFLASPNQAHIPFIGGGQGTLCLGTPIARFYGQLGNSGATGSFDVQVDLTAIPYPNPRTVQPGETWNFQAWFRDNDPTPTTNLTDGVSITFQ